MKDFGLRGLFGNWNEPADTAAATELPAAKACLVTAVGEIIRRLGERDRAEISSPADAFTYFADLRDAKKERVRVACLSPENLVFYSEDAAVGDAHETSCPLIAVLHPPLRFFAQRIIVAHNHPRGSAEPSEADFSWHAELVDVAKKLKIEVVDHVIIGEKNAFSFAEAGLC